MTGTGLQCLTVMHQCLDRIGGNCPRKLFLVRLATLDDGNRQYLLTEIGIDI